MEGKPILENKRMMCSVLNKEATRILNVLVQYKFTTINKFANSWRFPKSEHTPSTFLTSFEVFTELLMLDRTDFSRDRTDFFNIGKY